MPTIGGIVVANGRRVPNREALVSGDRRWTWAELDAQVGQVAATLGAAGLGHGDRLALLGANIPEMVIASFAASRLAAIVVPVNTRLAPPEIAYVLADCAPTVLAVGTEQVDVAANALILVESDARPRVLGLQQGSPHPWLLAEGAGGAAPVTEDRATEADDAFIVYTSGTTGNPKGVLLDHHRAIWAALAQVVSLGLRDGERYLHLPPLYHSGGVVFLNAMALLGGTNVLVPGFEPGAVLAAIEGEQVTCLLGVPTMYSFLLRHPDIDRRDLSSWRVGVFGAAPMPPQVVEALLRTLPQVSFFQQCGQTEAGPTGIYSTMDQVRERPDSSGHLAQPFVEARVVDQYGVDVGPGQIGELLFRGEPVMKGYWRQPVETARTIRENWLHTGDLVEVGAGGAMKLVDRLKDMIIAGGRNVYSAEVEQALSSHPDVVDCAVVGRPDPDWGETVVAVVTPRPDSTPTLDGLRDHCRALIADYKIPRVLILGPVPRNAAGKLRKHLLRNESADLMEDS